MKSGTFTNNTSFTATAAQVNAPTGNTSVGHGDRFTVPLGVKVIKVYWNENEYDDVSGSAYTYVGVTPGRTYEFQCYTFKVRSEDAPGIGTAGIYLGSMITPRLPTWFMSSPVDDIVGTEYYRGRGFELSWSPEINKMAPTYTDY